MGFVVSFIFSLTVLAVIVQIHHVEATFFSNGSRRQVDGLLEKLKEVVDNAKSEAQEILEEAKIQLNKLGLKTRNTADDKLEGIGKGFETKLDDLKRKTRNAEYEVCLVGNENKLTDLQNHLSDVVTSCYWEHINQGELYHIRRQLNEVREVLDDVKTIERELKKCSRLIHGQICLSRIGSKIGDYIALFPAKIRASADDTLLLIDKLKIGVEKCGSKEVNQYKNDGNTILEAIATCIEEKNKNEGRDSGSTENE